jgi:HEAT repeat protein
MAVKFAEILHALSDTATPLTRAVMRRLSNLDDTDRETLYANWGGLPVKRRQEVIRHLTEMLETDFDADFNAVIRLALTDLDEKVREYAVEASWPDESPSMFNRLLPMATIDLAVPVRAAALSALGRFILLGELGKFDRSLSRQAENIAIRLFRNKNEPNDVRRRALEAVANSSRDEVTAMINEAYSAGDPQMQASAVYAMGRTCDERWAESVLRELGSDDAAIRFEAVRASGELALEEAVPQLGPLLVDADRQTMEMVIWTLGEVGGGEARRLLTNMSEYAEARDDKELMEQIEDAMAESSLAGGEIFFDG